MTSSFRYEPDRIAAELLAASAASAALNLAAQAALLRMRTFAGGMRATSYFAFRGSLSVIHARPHDPDPTAYVGSSSPGWHLQEYGTQHNAPRAILRRGIKAIGIRFEEGR